MTAGEHGAAAAALGYLYQFDWALVEVLEAYPEHADRRLSIEKLDDIGWEDDAGPVALKQLKHHGADAASLTDAQADVWRTVGVWLDAGDPADPDGPALHLVTTQTAADGSAMQALRAGGTGDSLSTGRVERAEALLTATASSSDAKATAKVRGRFLALERSERLTMLSRVTVLDGAVPIQGLEARLVRAIGHGMPSTPGPFLDELRGWWGRTVLRLLADPSQTMRVLDAHVYLARLRDRYTPTTLPTTVAAGDVKDRLPDASGRRFVKQLEWVGLGPAQTYIELAVLDYYRAYEQRAAWGMDDLIGIDELERFEARLREEWRFQFESALAELPAGATEQQKSAAGRALLLKVMDDLTVTVREHYREGWFARGSRHALADAEDLDAAIGWHPEFKDHLAALLSSSPA